MDNVQKCMRLTGNRKPIRVYLGFADFDGKNELCLLIVETSSKQIVTFYPFVETQVQEE